MAEYPALPLFTDAFISDTTHLSAAQTGGYLMLLIVAWRTPDCALPDDDALLARWARMDRRTWLNNKASIMSFWKQGDDAKWRQGRLSDERNYAEDKRNKNVLAGKASAMKRKNRGSTTVSTKPQHKMNEPTLTPIDSGTTVPSSEPPVVLCKMPFTDLPSAWKEWAINEKSWDDAIIADVWSAFREYWQVGKGKNTKRENWTVSWHNWCRKENFTPSRRGHYEQPKSKFQRAIEATERARAAREHASSEQT